MIFFVYLLWLCLVEVNDDIIECFELIFLSKSCKRLECLIKLVVWLMIRKNYSMFMVLYKFIYACVIIILST